MPIPKFQARSNKRRSFFLAVGTALLLAACVVGNWYVSRTYHLAAVQDGVLYRDGNRGLREFATAVRRVRPKVVVSLIDDGELNDPNKPQFMQEADFLSTHGIRQIRIPVKLGGWPSSDRANNCDPACCMASSRTSEMARSRTGAMNAGGAPAGGSTRPAAQA